MNINRTWLAAIASVAVITGAAGYWIGRAASNVQRPTATVSNAANKEHKVL